jgi:PAS domain S-box-containing protein
MNEFHSGLPEGVQNDAFKRLFLELIEGTETDWLKELLDGVNEAILIAQEGHIRYFNRSFQEIIGRSPEELFKTPFLDLIHPDDRMMIFERHHKRISGEDVPNDYTFRIIDKTEKTRWVRIRVISIKWRSKPATLSLLSDITGDTGSRDSYRKLLDNAFDAIYLIDDTGYVYVNPGFERLSGYSSTELTSEEFDYNRLLTERSKKLIRERYEARKRGENISPRYSTQVKRKDGSVIEVEVTTVPMSEENRILVLGIMRDVTQRMMAEEALKKEKEYYLSFLESLGDWAWEIDNEGVYIFSNPVVKDILGYDKDEVVGRHVWDLWPEAYRSDDTIDQFKRKLTSGNSWRNMRGSIQKMDGTIMVTESTGVPLFDNLGNLIGYRGLDRDVTRRYISEEHMKKDMEDLEKQVEIRTRELWELNRDLEEQIKEKEKLQEEMLRIAKLDSLGVLAGGIAHDFNNLLTGIIGNLSLTSTKPGDSEWIKDRISDAENAARRARGLTRQLLTFSKGGNPVLKPTSLEELIEETCRFALAGSKVKADIDVENNLWFVEADQGQINQVIHNLVINASQAMPEGGYIWIRAKNVDLMKEDGVPLLPGRYVRIDVEDEGCGIPKDHLKRIFDPYYTTKETGDGLGLASCYSIIKHHNGYISARSRLGEGTRFIIYLPATSRKDPDQEIRSFVSDDFKGSVLVMDNDEMVLNVMRNMLNTLGFDVFVTRDGFGAITLYNRSIEEGTPFTAALLELNIPGGHGGEETASRILEIHPEACLLAITAGNHGDLRKDPLFREVLTKPLRLTDLKQSFNRLLKEEKAAEESKKEG